MKRFVKHLLPLGALLVVSTMPVQASAAELTSANLNEVLKSNTNYTSQCNTYFNQAICKLKGQHDPAACGDLIIDFLECGKPSGSECPEKPEWPDVPDMEKPEKPDVPDMEKPEWPDVPNMEKPEWPDVPDMEKPEWPDVPDMEKPEKPDVPDMEKPEWPDVPDMEKPEKPDVPDTQKPETPDNDSGNQPGGQIGAYEQQVADLVNKERAAAGLPGLAVNRKLSQVAELKAEDMRDKNYFSHTSPTYGSPFDMMKQFGVTYKSAAENIAKGQKTPQSVMNGWMNSQGHKENILNSNYTEIGVGYVTDNKGNTYWVQMFIKP